MRLGEVTSNYDRVSKHYDRLTDIAFGRILGIEKHRERTVDLLGNVAGATVLDVGCGTGRNFPFLVSRVGARGRIIGVDYSQGMLDQARRRAQARGWDNVDLHRGDAVKLEDIPGPVDAVISVWCYGIVYDLEAALDRAIEILRPGGNFAIMDFSRSRPDRGPLRWLYPIYSLVLRFAGIDAAEDLDDARLRAKWERGRHLLQERLVGLREERYLQGTGMILAGRRPQQTGPEGGGQPVAEH